MVARFTSSPKIRLKRQRWRDISPSRLLSGGRVNDLGRLPRYAVFMVLGAVLIWLPIAVYLKTAAPKFRSETSLILPGAGISASVNLNDIGQASSYASSAFASHSVSPTETYKRLLGADRILQSAAVQLGLDRAELGRPRIELVDQTGLIRFEMNGSSPSEAQVRGQAVLTAFFDALDALRRDEQKTREDGGLGALREYQKSVSETRMAIDALQAETGLISAAQFDQQVQECDGMKASLRTLATSLAQKAAQVRALERSLGLNAHSSAASLKLFADQEYTALVQEISETAAQLSEVSAQYGSQHPQVVQARAAYDGARKTALLQASTITRIDQMQLSEMGLIAAGGRGALMVELVQQEAARAGLQREHDALEAQLQAENARLRALAPAAARLEDMQRDFSVAEAVFASAIARTQSSKTDVYGAYPLVQVLENPSLPDAPTSPNRTLAVAAGGAATGMWMIGLLLGWARRGIIARVIA